LQTLEALVANCLLNSVELGHRFGVNIRQALVVS
jgi:hypothetical protein